MDPQRQSQLEAAGDPNQEEPDRHPSTDPSTPFNLDQPDPIVDESASSWVDHPKERFVERVMDDDDYMMFNGEALTRVHLRPRSHLYYPDEETSQTPLKYLDVESVAHTDVEGFERITDSWFGREPEPDFP